VAIRKSKKGSVTVTHTGIVATKEVASALATISSARKTKRDLTLREDEMKEVVFGATKRRPSKIVTEDGDLLAEVQEIAPKGAESLQGFLDAIQEMDPDLYHEIVVKKVRIYKAARAAATVARDPYLKIKMD
jgi:hypothetical protein